MEQNKTETTNPPKFRDYTVIEDDSSVGSLMYKVNKHLAMGYVFVGGVNVFGREYRGDSIKYIPRYSQAMAIPL